MPTLTTNYSFNKPLVNNAVDEDLWGGQLNDNWDSVDTILGPRTANKYGAVIVQNDSDDGFDTITSQGTSGQVLTSAGDDALPVWSDGGSQKLLSTQTASSDANINFDDTLITSTYQQYIVELIDIVPSSDGAFFELLVSEDNGSTIKNTNEYDYAGYQIIASSGSVSGSVGNDAATILVSNRNVGNASGESLCGTVTCYNLAGTTSFKKFRTEISGEDNSGDAYSSVSGADYHGSVNAVNYLRFRFAVGNIASGTFKLYGVL